MRKCCPRHVLFGVTSNCYATPEQYRTQWWQEVVVAAYQYDSTREAVHGVDQVAREHGVNDLLFVPVHQFAVGHSASSLRTGAFAQQLFHLWQQAGRVHAPHLVWLSHLDVRRLSLPAKRVEQVMPRFLKERYSQFRVRFQSKIRAVPSQDADDAREVSLQFDREVLGHPGDLVSFVPAPIDADLAPTPCERLIPGNLNKYLGHNVPNTRIFLLREQVVVVDENDGEQWIAHGPIPQSPHRWY